MVISRSPYPHNLITHLPPHHSHQILDIPYHRNFTKASLYILSPLMKQIPSTNHHNTYVAPLSLASHSDHTSPFLKPLNSVLPHHTGTIRPHHRPLTQSLNYHHHHQHIHKSFTTQSPPDHTAHSPNHQHKSITTLNSVTTHHTITLQHLANGHHHNASHPSKADGFGCIGYMWINSDLHLAGQTTGAARKKGEE